MSTVSNDQSITFIPFHQGFDIIEKLNPAIHSTLLDISNRYDGLCELICNRILIDNDLGRGNHENYLKNRITIESLNQEMITSSHLLNVFSIFHKAIAYLFRIFPDNIFSFWDQWRLVDWTYSVNPQIFKKGLRNIENGEVLKLGVFHQGWFNLEGHSLLIKKIDNDQYVFFDPNHGEYRGLSTSSLRSKINAVIKEHEATNIFITRGTDYLKRLEG